MRTVLLTLMTCAYCIGLYSQSFGTVYTYAELDKWQKRYQKSNQEMLDKALLPFLNYTEKSKLQYVRLSIPKTDDSDPFAYYAIGNTITMSAQSMMFLWDICLAYTWLNYNRKDIAPVTDYVAMLRYQKRSNFPDNKYPAPLDALGISREVENNSTVSSQTLSLFNSARAAIIAHELGHIYYKHPGNRAPGVTRSQSRANEKQADLFALELLSRVPEIPVGSLIYHQVTSNYNWDSEDSTHPTSADRIANMADFIEQNAWSFTKTGDSKELVLSIAEQFRALSKMLKDTELQKAIQIAAENANTQSLNQNQGISNSRGQFSGNFNGYYIRYLPNGTSESLAVSVTLNRSGDFVQGGFNFGFGYAMITDGKVIGNKLYFNWSWGMYYGQGVFVEKNGLITGTWGYAGYARPESNGGEWKLGRY